MNIARWSRRGAALQPLLLEPAFRARSYVRGIGRVELAALAVAFLSSAFRLATYDPFADGPWPRHVAATILGLAIAALVWWIVHRRLEGQSVLPAVAALVVMWAGDAVHLARWLHPLTREGSVAMVSGAPYGSSLPRDRWTAHAAGDTDIHVSGGRLLLRSGPNSAGAVDLNLTKEGNGRGWMSTIRRALLPVEHGDWLTKRLTWTAAVQLSGQYYVIAELMQPGVRIQATPWGVNVMSPNPAGGLSETNLVVADIGNGAIHTWTFEWSPVRLGLYMDGRLLWEGPSGPPITFVRFGDQTRDALHGGAMQVWSVQYTWYRPTAAPPLDRSPFAAGSQPVTSQPTAPPQTAVATATATPPDPTPTVRAGPQEYVVQSGDTLDTIARQYGTTVEAIAARNGIRDRNYILVGQRLIIP
jgi:LysM repeat protein